MGWETLQTVLQITREVWGRGTAAPTREVAYAISSVPLTQATAAQFLSWWRNHWHIENRSHYVRDVSLGEDACQVSSGQAPQILAALRNTVLTLLRQAAHTNIAAALRHYSIHVTKALRLIGIPEN